jgi:hypothetical protein
MRSYTLSLAIGALIASTAFAADACKIPAPGACKEVQTCGNPNSCGKCGCNAGCEKYCKVVCEMKEVKKTVWIVKCEDFCTSLPNCPDKCDNACDSGCEKACAGNCGGTCKSCDPCASLQNRDYIPPKCGKVRTKKVLEKKEIVCKIPSYKCIVVYACASCGQNCGGEKVDQQAPAAPAPAPAPDSKTTLTAPEPPVVGASFMMSR